MAAGTPYFLPGHRGAMMRFGVEGGQWIVSLPRGRGGGGYRGRGQGAVWPALGHNGHRGLKGGPLGCFRWGPREGLAVEHLGPGSGVRG